MPENDGRESPVHDARAAAGGLRAAMREIGAAARYLTGFRHGLDPEVVARGGAWFPALGLLQGTLAASVVRLVPADAGPFAVAAAGVAALGALGSTHLALGLARAVAGLLTGGAREAPGAPSRAHRAAGGAAALGTTAVKAWALAVTPPDAVGPALALAAMLGRWAFVVQAYGSQSARAQGLSAVFPRAMQFREFGIASVSAMALTLVLADAVGLVLLLWTAGQTIAVRILVHARAGGIDEDGLAGGAELAEASTLVLCAGLARALLPG